MVGEKVDVVIVGGGHNGLVAAGYLAKAGRSVVVLERLDVLGGAAVSARAFEGVDARLSRYSYLVSLLPRQIIDDLGLEVELAPRRYGSYTPTLDGRAGLLIDEADATATRNSFDSIGAREDYERWNDFYATTSEIARTIFPTALEPLRRESDVRSLLGNDTWQRFFQQPIGQTIEESFSNDLVRGVVMTDALIGTFASDRDETLQANKCFLYHVIGNETGEWNIPVGGMGAITESMARRARVFGADLRTSTEVTHIEPRATSQGHTVTFRDNDGEHQLTARHVLVNVAKPVLARLMGEPATDRIEGAQVKVNMVLKRLPRLKSEVDPRAAFGGTFHINEGFDQLRAAFVAASNGKIPNPLPCEIYCHSLTDPSILGSALRASGAQTLTVFALHAPHSLLDGRDNGHMREAFEDAVIDSLNSVLAEDIRELLVADAQGKPCIETKTTLDLERSLGLPGGNIFHGPLEWPYVWDDAPLDTPAQRWGVDSGIPGLYFCGSTARRGGAVSGIGGHNAAQAVLADS